MEELEAGETAEVQVQVQVEWRAVALTLSPCGKQNQTTRKTGALACTRRYVLLVYRLQHSWLYSIRASVGPKCFSSLRPARFFCTSSQVPCISKRLISSGAFKLLTSRKEPPPHFDRRPSHRSHCWLRIVTVHRDCAVSWCIVLFNHLLYRY